MNGWKAHTGYVAPVTGETLVRVDLGEGNPETGLAKTFTWGAGAGPDGEGRILRYQVLADAPCECPPDECTRHGRAIPAAAAAQPEHATMTTIPPTNPAALPYAPPWQQPALTMVGDLTSNERGSGARFNASKPPLELIPLQIIGRYFSWRDDAKQCPPSLQPDWAAVLRYLGTFQMSRGHDRLPLYQAIYAMDADGKAWAECARVFDYGRAKYAAWNWAKGQPWSVPIACGGRHIVFGTMVGEDVDPESGLSHRGHVMCNIVMLLWFLEHYREGDDRADLPHSAA